MTWARIEPLIGRKGDLAAVADFVHHAASSGGSLYICGPAGIGKSAVLRTAAVEAVAEDVRVLFATGAASEGDVRFAGLHQIVHPLLDSLTDLPRRHRDALGAALGLAGLGPVSTALVAEATTSLLRHTTPENQVLIVVDDFPGMDDGSASVLRSLLIDGAPVGMLLAGSTTTPVSDLPGKVYALAPLTPEASAQLLDRHSPLLAPAARGRVLAEAHGNPLALLELPAALTAAQLSGAGVLPDLLPLTPRLQTAFSGRAAALPASAQRLLLLAALEGTGDQALIRCAYADRSFDDSLNRAENAGLVYVGQETGKLEFDHPLTRSAVAELSADGDHRRAHEALARCLVHDPERRVWHLARATVGPDERVADALELVAHRHRRRGQIGNAVAALTRSAMLSPDAGIRSQRLAAAAYLGADVSGRLREVPRLLEAAHDDSNGELSLAAAVAISHHMLLSGDGDVDTAHSVLVGAIERHTGSAEVLIEALYTLVWICFFAGRPELWEAFERTFRRPLATAPESLLFLKACLADPLRHPRDVLDRLDRAVARLTGTSDPVDVIRIGMAAAYVDRLEGCRAALCRIFEQGRAGENITLQIHASNLLSRLFYGTGDWPAMARLAETALDLSERYGYRLLALTFRHRLGLLAAAQGRHEQAEQLADDIVRFAAPRRIELFVTLAAQIKILAALGRGEAEEAYLQGNSIFRGARIPDHNATVVWMLLDVAEAAVRSGRRSEAQALVDALDQADVPSISSRLALVTHGAAGMAADDADYARRFEQALNVRGSEVWAFDRARIQLHYGERLRRAKVAVAARQNLTAALETFRRLGATPWEKRARNELRASGLPDDEADLALLGELTPQQREIALLAASGLTNKQIGERLRLSPRTVGTHLYQTFPKLGISSRAALRDALGRGGTEARP
jgi:DNA-binding CsgD family transcriptional regulator